MKNMKRIIDGVYVPKIISPDTNIDTSLMKGCNLVWFRTKKIINNNRLRFCLCFVLKSNFKLLRNQTGYYNKCTSHRTLVDSIAPFEIDNIGIQIVEYSVHFILPFI